MNLNVNLDIQKLVSVALTADPLQEIEASRAREVPLKIAFIRDDVIFDPEVRTAKILFSEKQDPQVYIYTDGPHGFKTGDSVIISGHTGSKVNIDKSEKWSESVTTGTPPDEVTTVTVLGTKLTTTSTHGLHDNQQIVIAGHTSAPNIDGTYLVKVIDALTFGIPVETNAAPNPKGFGGTVQSATTFEDLNNSVVPWAVTVLDQTTFAIAANITKEGVGGEATFTKPMSIRWTLKEMNKFDQDPIAICDVFEKISSGGNTYFRGAVDYFTADINRLLGIDLLETPPTANDVASVEVMAEVSWEGHSPGKTKWIRHTINNDIYKGGDQAPSTVTNLISKKILLGVMTTDVVVVFTPPFSSDKWHFYGLVMSNTTDAAAPYLFPTLITARSASGFTVHLSGSTGIYTGYRLEFTAIPD
jgi:hypothetical protein